MNLNIFSDLSATTADNKVRINDIIITSYFYRFDNRILQLEQNEERKELLL
jgi:hypothetical protein